MIVGLVGMHVKPLFEKVAGSYVAALILALRFAINSIAVYADTTGAAALFDVIFGETGAVGLLLVCRKYFFGHANGVFAAEAAVVVVQQVGKL
jgi:phosphoribosyl 1,2-cyclic phosphodiesterase